MVTAFGIAMGLALFDTVTDGLAIDVTPPEQRVLIQGAMAIGRALGMVTLASVYGRLATAYGWPIVFWLAAIFLLAPLPLLWRVREPALRPAAQTFDWAAIRYLWRPATIIFVVYGILYAFVVYGANAVLTLFANEELGANLIEVGDVAALSGLGMLAGGGSAVLIARKVSIWLQGIFTCLAVSAVLVTLAFSTLDNIYMAALLWGVCLAAVELVFVTLAMIKADPRIGASSFATFMAISNIGTGAGQATTTGLIGDVHNPASAVVDYRWIFLGMALLNLVCIPLLLAIQGRPAQSNGAGRPGLWRLRWRKDPAP
jgi:PAT family beta-lactamase induction signal transducer AmpG